MCIYVCVLRNVYVYYQADFTDWIPFLPSNLMEEIRPNPKALSTVPLKPFISMKRKLFKYKYFNMPNWIAYFGNKYTLYIKLFLLPPVTNK